MASSDITKSGKVIASVDQTGDYIQAVTGDGSAAISIPTDKDISIAKNSDGTFELVGPNGYSIDSKGNLIDTMSDPDREPTIVQKGYLDKETCETILTNVNEDNWTNFNTALYNAKESYKRKAEDRKKQFENDLNAAIEEDNRTFVAGSVAADMTRNTDMYGTNISQLMWPIDILDSSMHNGMYTAFFISEHEDATIAQEWFGYNKAQGSQRLKHRKAGFLYDSFKDVDEEWKDITSTAMNFLGAAKVGVFAGAAAKSVASGLGKVISGVSGGALTKFVGTATGALAGAASFWGNDNIGVKTSYVQLKSCIILPTPQISSVSSLKWNSSGDGLATAVSGATHLVTSMLPSAANSKKKLTIGDAVGDAADALAIVTGNTASGGILGKIIGKTVNSRKEQLFDEVDFRSYDFKYTLFARSQEEMRNIQSIITVFKYHAHPELSPSTLLYTYPAQFDIVHYFEDRVNSNLPKHATSVLTDVAVEYGEGDFMSITNDGAPTVVNLTLKFIEIAILNRDDMLNGY